MTSILQDCSVIHNELEEFENDVMLGLSAIHKNISSKYLYDAIGSDLFNQITRHPDYYLTRCEIEIINDNKEKFSNIIKQEPFNLVELGPGEGVKSKILIEQFLNDSLSFTYMPIDISKKYLTHLLSKLKDSYPHLNAESVNSDFLQGLTWIKEHSKKRNIVLFLGSSIGNFNSLQAKEFFYHLRESLNPGDYVLIGFDLCKDPEILINAYNDKDKITSEFNYNLLARMNRELNANFNIEKFRHYPVYNVYNSEMESYLISLEPQVVYIGNLKRSFVFHEIEPIHIEISHKYRLLEIEQFAANAGFNIVNNYMDKKNYFVDSLWQVQ
jgi:L-histidine N-alpha-methyltransferase